MTNEQLIELVERYPVLYDINLAQYRDHNVRYNAWEEIAEQMNTTAEEVRDRWGKLRNCFTNALKRHRKKSGQASTNIVPWKFEKQMEFLLPHVEGRKPVTNLGDSNDDDSTQDSELQFSEESTVSPPPTIRSRTLRPSTSRATAVSATPNSPIRTARRTNKYDYDDKLLRGMVNIMKSSQNSKQKRAVMDENDYFFLSMSKQLKKLPKTDQAEIKLQLHKLIHDSEMKMLKVTKHTLINDIPNQTRHDSENMYSLSTNQTLSEYSNDHDYSRNEISEAERVERCKSESIL